MAAVAGARSASATLAAATEDVVTLSTAVGASKLGEVANSGTDPIYARADGTAATVAGDECQVVLGGERLVMGLTAEGTISLISSGTPSYTVAVVN